MPNRCVAPGCKVNYGSCKEKCSMFAAPKEEERRLLWQRANPRMDFVLKPSHYLCEKHFHEENIVRKITHKDQSDKIIAQGAELHSWNSWGDNPAAVVSQKDPIQQQIEQYRQQAARSNSTGNEEEAVQPNFFEDMTPQITKQTKILLRTNDAKPAGWGETVSSRLTLAVDPVLCSSPDLGTWEDSPGWEDQTQEDWDPDAILREKRRLERQRRLTAQQQKKQEKELSKVGRAPALGARIS